MSGWRQINNTGVYGTTRVGIPSEDCTGLLTGAAQEYPDDLLRAYVTYHSLPITVAENGAYVTTGPTVVVWDLYVNGVYVNTRITLLDSDYGDVVIRDRRLFGREPLGLIFRR